MFSNIVGNIFDENENKFFNNHMNKYLMQNCKDIEGLIFVNAPGLGGEESYLKNIIRCFEKINISFLRIIEINKDIDLNNINKFDRKNCIYFLMGGDPISQMELIKKYNLINEIKNYKGLVIGFCAGAINLSKYSIITSDKDFEFPSSYRGINRVDLIVEPHYNKTETIDLLKKRNDEILNFAKEYNNEIIALADDGIITVEDDIVNIVGENKIFSFKD